MSCRHHATTSRNAKMSPKDPQVSFGHFLKIGFRDQSVTCGRRGRIHVLIGDRGFVDAIFVMMTLRFLHQSVTCGRKNEVN